MIGTCEEDFEKYYTKSIFILSLYCTFPFQEIDLQAIKVFCFTLGSVEISLVVQGKKCTPDNETDTKQLIIGRFKSTFNA